MRQAKRRKTRSKVTPSAARAMLKALREFMPDFASISMSPDGTISVTAHGAKPSPEQVKAAKAAQEAAKPRLTAIEALSRPVPTFEYETEN